MPHGQLLKLLETEFGRWIQQRTDAALALWQDKDKRKTLVTKIMKTDFSWSASATKYLEMYAGL